MRVARSAAMLVAAAAVALGLASTASAATCAGSGYLVTDGGGIQRFSTSTNAVTTTLAGGTRFTDVAIAPDGRTAYAVDYGADVVRVIDTATNAVRASLAGFDAPVAIAIAPDGARAYVVDEGSSTFTVIDTATGAAVASHPTEPGPADAVVSADGGLLYVAAHSRLIAYSTATGAPQTTVDLVGAGAAVVRSATTAFVALVDRGHGVAAVPLGGSTATTPYTGLTGLPQTVALSPDGATLYIGTDAVGAESLLAVDLRAGGAPTPIGGGAARGAFSVATSADGTTVYAGGETGVAVLASGGTAAGTLAGGPTTRATAIATCPAVVPAAPTAVVADPGDAIAAVSWTAPADSGGAPVTGYTATASPGGATCTTTGALACTIGGLRNGTAYTFAVTAANRVGTGPASTPSKRVTPRRDNRARALAIGPATVTYTRKGVGVAFGVTATGPGVIAAAMTYKGTRFCTLSRRVAAAGTYRVRCVMAAAGRGLARRRAVTYTLLATFSPTYGPLASARAPVVVPRRR